MARDWSTTGLLKAIRRKAYLPPSGDHPFSDTELLDLADEAMDEIILPAIEAVREDYYVVTDDQSAVANQAEYRIPTRATNGVLRDVVWIDASGNGVSMAYELLERRDYYQAGSYPTSARPMFTIQGDHVVLLPAPSSSTGTIRIRYYRRPGKLDQDLGNSSSDSAKITSVAGAVYTCDFVPTAWTTSTVLDFIDGDPTFESLADDQTPDAVATGASGTITMASALAGVGVGDYIAETGQSPVPQIPESFHTCLSTAVAMQVLLDMGDREQAAMLGSKLTVDLEKAQGRITPRVHGESTRVTNWDSPLRSGIRGRSRWLL